MKYVKKAIPVEAFQWDAGKTKNPKWMDDFVEKGRISFVRRGDRFNASVFTVSGVATLNIGDYLINAGGDDIYPVKRDIFESTYQEYKPVVKKVTKKKANNG